MIRGNELPTDINKAGFPVIELPTLRDQFAMSRPITLTEYWVLYCGNPSNISPSKRSIEGYCKFRYEYADAMLKARGEG